SSDLSTASSTVSNTSVLKDWWLLICTKNCKPTATSMFKTPLSLNVSRRQRPLTGRQISCSFSGARLSALPADAWLHGVPAYSFLQRPQLAAVVPPQTPLRLQFRRPAHSRPPRALWQGPRLRQWRQAGCALLRTLDPSRAPMREQGWNFRLAAYRIRT